MKYVKNYKTRNVMIYVTTVLTARSVGLEGLIVEQRVQITDIGIYWKGATLNIDRKLLNNAKNIKFA